MPPEAWTILKLLNCTTEHFKSHHIEQPRAAAEILLAHTLSVQRLDLYIQYDRPLEPKELEVFRKLIQRRLQREPVAYIVGTQGFWSLDLKVSRDVLIPRPETETLVEAALTIIPKESSARQLKVLDLGTGSGAVVLALATERAGHYYYATDCSKKALAVARNNALAHGLDDAITFIHGRWFDAVKHLAQYFDVVLSNPPYISDLAFPTLPPEVSQYEPREALAGGPDGLEAIRLIVEKAADYMASGGSLLFEIGYDQRRAVEGLIAASGSYTDLTILKDASGLDRVVQVKTRKRPKT